MSSMAERYQRAAALWPANLAAAVLNGRLVHRWLDDDTIGYGDVVVNVTTGERRAATALPATPGPLQGEGAPPPATVSSPDGSWSIVNALWAPA